MKESESPGIIIIGGNHHNTLGVVRALGVTGLKNYIHLILNGDKNSFVYRSKYIDKSRTIFVYEDDEIPEQIIKVSKTMSHKPIVICCGDHFINVIDCHFDYLKEYAIVPNAKEKEGRISYYLSKDNQSVLARECGLKVPTQQTLTAKELDLASIGFPCIIKPLNSVIGGKADIKICYSFNELREYKESHQASDEVRVEEYITKSMEFQLIGCSLEQQIIIPGYTHLIRQPKNTNTGYLKYSPISDGVIGQDLINKVHDFIHKIGYKGLFSVEFIRDNRGEDYFLEINMRNDGNAYCVTTAGVNLPYIWYKYANNPNAKITEKTSFEKPIYWMPEADAKFIKSVGLIKWLANWFKADSHGITSLRDPLPLICTVYNKLKSKILK